MALTNPHHFFLYFPINGEGGGVFGPFVPPWTTPVKGYVCMHDSIDFSTVIYRPQDRKPSRIKLCLEPEGR